jgi:hypothetical protein
MEEVLLLTTSPRSILKPNSGQQFSVQLDIIHLSLLRHPISPLNSFQNRVLLGEQDILAFLIRGWKAPRRTLNLPTKHSCSIKYDLYIPGASVTVDSRLVVVP